MTLQDFVKSIEERQHILQLTNEQPFQISITSRDIGEHFLLTISAEGAGWEKIKQEALSAQTIKMVGNEQEINQVLVGKTPLRSAIKEQTLAVEASFYHLLIFEAMCQLAFPQQLLITDEVAPQSTML